MRFIRDDQLEFFLLQVILQIIFLHQGLPGRHNPAGSEWQLDK
jgi:hypothetical protein